MRHFLTALTLALVAACAPAPAPATTTDQWADAPMSAPPAQPDTEEARSCAARGGAMQPVCRMQTMQCVVQYSDAGQASRTAGSSTRSASTRRFRPVGPPIVNAPLTARAASRDVRFPGGRA